jgi:hypothetical protein
VLETQPDLASLAEQLERIERALEEHAREWQALKTRIDPLLRLAESMTGRRPTLWKR